jgi:excisionase family DNA binding protein
VVLSYRTVGENELSREMTVKELAARLRVHPSTIYKYLRRGEIPGVRTGQYWTIRFPEQVRPLPGGGTIRPNLPPRAP